MSGDIVERVARAIVAELERYCVGRNGCYAFCDHGSAPDGGWRAEVDGEFSTWTLARAAIEETLRAVMDAPPAVIAAGADAAFLDEPQFRLAFKAAIDALLAAIADRNPEGEDAQRLSAEHESAMPAGQSPNPIKETPHAG